eukprot:5321319-Prymnesium_polylepis.1
MTGKQDVDWLSDSMSAEKCTLALQPDDLGRRSALGPPRLYVGATSNLPHAHARGYIIEGSDTMLIYSDTGAITTSAYGTWNTNCFELVGEASPWNLFSHSEASKCGQLIGLEGASLLEQIATVTHLFFGPYVQTFAFFDNKLEDNHVALVRCQTQTAGPCWMEFHVHPVGGDSDDLKKSPDARNAETAQGSSSSTAKSTGASSSSQRSGPTLNPTGQFTDALKAEIDKPFYLLVPCPNFAGVSATWFGGCTLKTAMRVPAGLSSLKHDSEQSALPAQYFTAAFTGQTRQNVHASECAR